MAGTSYLTNDELIAQLSLRDDLTQLEHELLDRLILATEEVVRLDREVLTLRPAPVSDTPVG